jgi:AraC-like DNA-binding protein
MILPQTAKLVIPSEALGVRLHMTSPRPAARMGRVRGRGGMSASDPRNREKLPRAQAIPRDLRRAIDYMREDEGRRLSIADLVAHCGVSERTLHKHFRLFMEGSPLEYWRRHRLAAAREVFLKATSDTSVTEVATRFGFSHFGRFSQQYRRCFDETPSETLQRNRIAQEKRTAPAGGDAANASGAVGVVTRVWRERPSVTVIPFRVPAEWQWFGESLAQGIGDNPSHRGYSVSVGFSSSRRRRTRRSRTSGLTCKC